MLKRIILFASLCLPLAAQAANFDYSYIEGTLMSVDPAHGGSSLTGPGVDGSYALAPNVHAFAGYSHVSCCSVSQNTFDVGAGWNTQLADQLGLYLDGEFLSVNHSGNGTDNGWGATGGLRVWLMDRLELDGYVTHSDVNSNTENTLGARVLWSFDKNWRFFAGASNNSDYNTFLIGARYAF